MSEMYKKWGGGGGDRLRFGENMPGKHPKCDKIGLRWRIRPVSVKPKYIAIKSLK